MKFPIGAMSLGDILDRGLKLLLARWTTFYGIALVVMTPYLVAEVFLEVWSNHAAGNEGLGLNAAGIMLTILALTLLQPLVTAATLYVISKEFIDEPIGMWPALGFAMRRSVAIIGTSILAGLITAIGSFCVIPGILFTIWYALATQVVVIEGWTGTKALTRSQEVSSGYRWRLAGILLLIVLLGLGVLGAYWGLQALLPPLETVPTEFGEMEVPNDRNVIINEVANNLLDILVEAYGTVCLTLFYFDLRIRKEGFDLELAAKGQAVAVP
jgi:hypothetical protein